MPAIYVFRKRTPLGGDDLHLPALLTISTRAFQCLVLILPQLIWMAKEGRRYASNLIEFVSVDPSISGVDSDGVCRNSHFFPLLTSMYLIASGIFAMASIGLEYQIWWWSGQGTPTTDRQPRTSKMEFFLELKLLVFSLVLTLIVATHISAAFYCREYLQCRNLQENVQETQQLYYQEDDAMNGFDYFDTYHDSRHIWIGTKSWWAFSSILVASQGVEIVLAVVFWIRVVEADKYHVASATRSVPHELTEELWADRCSWMCKCLSMSTCFLFGGQDFLMNGSSTATGANSTSVVGGAGGSGVSYYEHLSRALADYLETRGTLDVVASDIVTGLLVLQRLQRQRLLQARVQVVRSSQTQIQVMQRDSLIASLNGDDRIPSNSRSSTLSSSENKTENAIDLSMANDRKLSFRRSESDILPRTSDSTATLRSRALGAGNSSSANCTTTKSYTSFGAMRREGSSDSLHLPETSHLVLKEPPQHVKQSPLGSTSTQSIYRRLEDIHSEPRPTTTSKSILFRSENNSIDSHGTVTNNARLDCPTQSLHYQRYSRAVLNPHNPVDCRRLQEGARMAKYALSIYTWMLYIFVHPITGIPQLLCRSCRACKFCTMGVGRRQRRRPHSEYRWRNNQSRTSNGVSSNNEPTTLANGNDFSILEESRDEEHDEASSFPTSPTTIGDNICGWHKHSLLLVAGLEETELVYAQFVNRFSLVPYCILLDHASRAVVVSIRGSLSLDDLVTDVHIDPECLKDMGEEFGFDAEGQYCHAGVVACARNVYRDFQRHGLLEELLEHEFPEYHLRLVGHSLGAGVCTLLGYMLQRRYPSLRVFNFSPPGCTMTWDLATRCESWATTFVLDSDIVPRLSVLALERLRDEVLELVGRLKVPKYQIVESFWTRQSRRGCWGATGASPSGSAAEDLQDLTLLIDDWLDETPPDSIYQQQLQEFWSIQEERKRTRGDTRSLKLYPPGRMIHLLKTGEEGGWGNLIKKVATCCTSNSGFQYTPVYIANDDLDEIVVCPTMGTDHFIDRIVDEISGIADNYSMILGSTSVDGSEEP